MFESAPRSPCPIRIRFSAGCYPMIRNLTERDLSELAEIRLATASDAAEKRRIRVAFTQLYPQLLFDTPWSESAIAGLVSTDATGALNGMLAAGGRPLQFEGRPITAAIGADFHVPQEARSTMAGVALLKQFFNGRQDVTICDVANNSTRRIWERLGGFVASAYNLNWIGVLRPLRLAGSVLCERRGLGLIGKSTMGISAVVDRMLPQRLTCRINPVSRGMVAETLAPDEFSRHLQELTQDDAVQPVYSLDAAEWMWKRLAYLSPDSGDVSAVVVRNSQGRLLGWYIYDLCSGGTARVAQIAARQNNAATVINHLFARVFDEGAGAVAGRLQPRFQQVLIDQGCLFRGRSSYTLIHTTDPGIAAAYRSGSAWLSALDGETSLNAWNSPESAAADLSSLLQHSSSRPRIADTTPASSAGGR